MDKKYTLVVGRNIRTIRKKNKLTQDQLAAKLQVLGCDITRSTLAKMEAGQRYIYLDELKALKKILNVPFDDILT